jgi:hypothetical protein
MLWIGGLLGGGLFGGLVGGWGVFSVDEFIAVSDSWEQVWGVAFSPARLGTVRSLCNWSI